MSIVRNPSGSRGRRLLVWLAPAAALPLMVVALCWWFTEPLSQSGSAASVPDRLVAPKPLPALPEAAASTKPKPAWPEGRLDGHPAKVLLLDTLLLAQERLNKVGAYTATFR